MNNLLLSLMRSALWGDSFERKLSPKEFKDVLLLAEEQTVFGLVFEILSKQIIIGCEALVFDSIGKIEGIKLQNQLTNRILVDFIQLMHKNGVDVMVVKGQTIGGLYPNPSLRMSGDIDYLIKKEYVCVKESIEKTKCIELPDKLILKEYAYIWKGIPFELHRSLLDFACKKHQILWEHLVRTTWEEAYYLEIDSVRVRTLPPTLNAAYVFLHLFFHFIRGGVSLRQVCDWSMVLHQYRQVIDWEFLHDILVRFDVLNAYIAFGYILVEDLGLSKDAFPFPLAIEYRSFKLRILTDIFKGGNFGRQNHKARNTLWYKMETMTFVLRNCIQYYKLAPSEMRMMVPLFIKINFRNLIFRF